MSGRDLGSVRPPRRRYAGFIVDSSRWERFALRPDDVVISTPSKCGTTWMQTIVGMLLLDRTDLGAPISTISPWLDMLTRSEAEVFELLERQEHRRFVKTHTPLDGLPQHPSVTYLTIARHPLDVALSNRDHDANTAVERAIELRIEAVGTPDTLPVPLDPPDDPGGYVRWFIDNDVAPTGSGPHGLDDYCQQVRTYWDARHEPNVHLFHYADLWADTGAEMRRLAEVLGVTVEDARWHQLVAAADLAAMRQRASETAPEAHLGMWNAAQDFFRVGGTRGWAALLTPAELDHFERRLRDLAGDAAPWILTGRAALT